MKTGLAAFRRMGMIVADDSIGCDRVAKWGERQFESDEVAQRTRKHRSQRDESPPEGTTLERSYDVPGNADPPDVGTPPETETETDTDHHPQTTPTSGSPQAVDDDDPDRSPAADSADRRRLVDQALDLIGDQRHQRALTAGAVRNPSGHRTACRQSARSDHAATAHRLADTHPDWTPTQLAEAITRLADGHTPPATDPAPSRLYEAAERRRLHQAATAPDRNPDAARTGIAQARAALTTTGDQ